MATWRLRAGRPADVPAMHALDLVCFAEPFRFDRSSMRRFANRPGAIVVVARSGGELAGFVIVHRERGDLAYVVTLDVAPAHRRKGMAAALIGEAERQAHVSEADRMGLHVSTGNTDAIRFYESLGYERKGLEEDFYGKRMDAFVYIKQLPTT